MKKLSLALIGLAMSCALLAGNAFAAAGWAVCTPKKIGPYGDYVLVQVINCNVDPTNGQAQNFMELSATGTDQMMASILTAMSLGKTIAVHYDDANVSTNGYNIADAVIFTN